MEFVKEKLPTVVGIALGILLMKLFGVLGVIVVFAIGYIGYKVYEKIKK